METTLGDITNKVFVGLQTSADAIYVLTIPEGQDTSDGPELRLFSKSLNREITIERDLLKPFLLGRDLHRYCEPDLSRYVVFPYALDNGTARLYSEQELCQSFPKGYQYLVENQGTLRNRERGRFRGSDWYAYGRTNNLANFEQPKILMRELGDQANLFPDYAGVYYHTTKIYSIVPGRDSLGVDVILGILNSKLCSFFVANTSEIWGKSFKFKTQFVEPLGIPADALDVARHDKMVELVETMLELHKRLAKVKTPRSRERIQRQIAITDQAIDKLVYELYELTDEEIVIV